MSIFNRVKSAIKRYLCHYQKRWVYIHIGWVFLVAQIIALLRAGPGTFCSWFSRAHASFSQ